MKLKIVVIDDEECIRDSLRWFLENLGHEVITFREPSVCDVYQGHNCNRSLPCGDVLLIDYNMPNINGLEYIERLANQGCKGVSANMILMSGNTMSIDQAKAHMLGCKVMQKPIPFNFLEAWLDEVKVSIGIENRPTGNVQPCPSSEG